MSPNKNPGVGTKVTLGEDAPVTLEGAGLVPSDSLAAESKREGGEFSSNRGIRSENVPSSDNKSSATRRRSHSEGALKSSEDIAPTHVSSQHRRDPNGPHGKNLHEGGWDESKAEDGIQKAFNAEPGSMDDPSRLAERQFQLKQAAGRHAESRQVDVEDKTVYDALESEVPS
ncbi:hypothetical protein BGZ61DRAFT_507447 [Ilyonectria robusta]|uniref:uncharacterized protein n=1 Tax=Ilyonectria robusta TaxID=1079257 RepID=UPI001E8D4D17|nr:uncharacterized protein BGZ61DRAFT_507447 [Ilyonectria robusta]KAH8685293.1 hypothetical protein BGZ61DRAFT_507447 [Ilyonectria robusta]